MKRESKHSKAVSGGSRFSEPTPKKNFKKEKKIQSNSLINNINIKKIIIFIIIIGIIIFGIVMIVKKVNNPVTISDDTISIASAQEVEGLEELEVTNFSVEKNETSYSIKLNFKNNSDKKQDTFQSYINILNKDENIILGLYFYVPEIPANSEKECSIICSRDLSDTYSYSIKRKD